MSGASRRDGVRGGQHPNSRLGRGKLFPAIFRVFFSMSDIVFPFCVIGGASGFTHIVLCPRARPFQQHAARRGGK